jgi:hypothetical protein
MSIETEDWQIIQALTWLAFDEPMTLARFVKNEQEMQDELNAADDGQGVKLAGFNLDSTRVCRAARSGDLSVYGRKGMGPRYHSNMYHADFEPPQLIDAIAFSGATINYYNPPHLSNSPSGPIWYFLMVESAEFKEWAAHQGPTNRIRIPDIDLRGPGQKMAQEWLRSEYGEKGRPAHLSMQGITDILNRKYGKLLIGGGRQKVSMDSVKRALGKRS